MPAKKKNPKSRNYLRIKTKRTTDEECKVEAEEADSKEKTAQQRAEAAVNGTVSGMKDPSFWK